MKNWALAFPLFPSGWAGVVGLILLGGLSGCMAPAQELWPPASGSEARLIHVSLDTWHSMIAFPQPSGEARRPGFEEWGFAEEAWYLEGRQGISDVLRALLWPSSGVVEIAHHETIWAERTPQPPADLFSFQLSERGYRRLRRYLHSTVATPNPVAESSHATFYPAKNSYHLFHHCHQYVARALRKAGLPVSELLALTRSSLAWQLDRAVETQNDNLGQNENLGKMKQMRSVPSKPTGSPQYFVTPDR